jgi:ceramide glucosyltransferase
MILCLVKFLLFCAVLASIGYCAVAIFAANRFFAKKASSTGCRAECPPVSIMIPLCGADFRAYDCYAALCRQDYPVFQIVFGVQDPKDTSIAVIEKLRADFPETDIELVVDSGTIGVNPKVDNLHNMSGRARYETFVLVDSDIRVEPDYLSKIVSEFKDERVGLVTCLYRAGSAPNFPARIEAAGIVGGFAPGVLIANHFGGIRFAFGATIALTKEKLRSIGGFEAVADYLADDYMLGNLIAKAGYRVALSPCVVETMLRPMSFMAMAKHQVRWARGIKACQPTGHIGSVVTYGIVLAFFYLLLTGASLPGSLLFAAAFAARMAMGWYVGDHCLGDRISARSVFLTLARDFFNFVVWCLSIAGRRVEWREKVFVITEGGKMKPAGQGE